jgi:sorting nexin-8
MKGLSKDTVDALRKKVEGRIKKIEQLRASQKTNWEFEADKLAAGNESDNTTITNSLSRRIFVRACMWHELGVVFHSRQAAQTTLGWRGWVKDNEEGQKVVSAVWEELGERLKSMPIE